MSKPASNQTRLHQAKAIARHRKQQEDMASLGIGLPTINKPNRAQRRAAQKQEKLECK